MKKFAATLAVCFVLCSSSFAQAPLSLADGNISLKDLQINMPEIALRLIGNLKKLPSNPKKDVITRYLVQDVRYLNMGKCLLNTLQLECLAGKLKSISAITPDIEASLCFAETLQDIFGIKKEEFSTHEEDFLWPGKNAFCSFVIAKDSGVGTIVLQANDFLTEKLRLEKLLK